MWFNVHVSERCDVYGSACTSVSSGLHDWYLYMDCNDRWELGGATTKEAVDLHKQERDAGIRKGHLRGEDKTL